MKLGIVGLPNVGKSTLFNAITNAGAQSANYPFCTIEPNVGVVAVPDKRLDKLAEMYNPDKYTPATIEFVDIAGLVKGASKGEGQFTLYAALKMMTLSTLTAVSIPKEISTQSTLNLSSQMSRLSTDESTRQQKCLKQTRNIRQTLTSSSV